MLKFSYIERRLFATSTVLLPQCTKFMCCLPQFYISIVFIFYFSETYNRLKRNKLKTMLSKSLARLQGASNTQTKCIMGDVEKENQLSFVCVNVPAFNHKCSNLIGYVRNSLSVPRKTVSTKEVSGTHSQFIYNNAMKQLYSILLPY